MKVCAKGRSSRLGHILRTVIATQIAAVFICSAAYAQTAGKKDLGKKALRKTNKLSREITQMRQSLDTVNSLNTRSDQQITQLNDALSVLNGRFTQIEGQLQSIQQTPGITGSAGASGPAGPKGDKGDRGDLGPAGQKGEKGERGDRGERGADGLPGRDGAPGQSASASEVASSLKADQAFLDSVKGDKGDKGDRGDDGTDGVDGADGRDGVDADPAVAAGLAAIQLQNDSAFQQSLGDALSSRFVGQGQANSIDAGMYQDDSISRAKIKESAVGRVQIADYAVGRIKIGQNAVDSSKIVDGSIEGADIAPGQIGIAHIATDQIQARIESCPPGHVMTGVNEFGDPHCVDSPFKLLAKGANHTEEARYEMDAEGLTFQLNRAHNQYVLTRLYEFPQEPISEILFRVRNHEDAFCIGSSFQQNLWDIGGNTQSVCTNLYYRGERDLNGSGSDGNLVFEADHNPANYIRLEVLGSRNGAAFSNQLNNCRIAVQDEGQPTAQTRNLEQGLFVVHNLEAECRYTVEDGDLPEILQKLVVEEVDWTEYLGRWNWEIYYR